MHSKHPVYAINLNDRSDRLAHIENEFINRDEFELSILRSHRNENGALGLWQNIVKIITKAQRANYNYIIICEDDHRFTESYNIERLHHCISQAQKNNADVLLGGVSCLEDTLQCSQSIFWIKKFSGAQFTIIFRGFFATILDADFNQNDAADFKISALSSSIFFIYPFISTQKEFGYSDVTPKNNLKGYVTEIFERSETLIDRLIKVNKYYKNLPYTNIETSQYNDLAIPTYVINRSERTERISHIQKQFEEKAEFNVSIVKACNHKIISVALWMSIRKVVKLAIANDDDVILICEDDHEFTAQYTKEYLLKNIIEAHQQGVDMLLGGVGSYGQSIPITVERYWVNPIMSPQFVLVFRKFFDEILSYNFQENDAANLVYSKLTLNKMLLYPFISVRKDFGHSNITSTNNANRILEVNKFIGTQKRLQLIKEAYLKYSLPSM